jgi:hypothetical protein
MKKTYKEFLDNLDIYADGAEIEPSFHEYMENRDLYTRAADEGYIMIGIGFMGYPRITILRHPVPYLSKEFINSYFN